MYLQTYNYHTCNRDVDFANGYVPVEIERNVFHCSVLERVERQFETLRLYFESSDATAVVHWNGFGHVDRFDSVRPPTYDNRLGRTILEHGRLVV